MTKREHAAILAGLRMLQDELEDRGEDIPMNVLTDEGTRKPITIEEINDLCERLNTDGDYKAED